MRRMNAGIAAMAIVAASIQSTLPAIPRKEDVPVAEPQLYRTKGEKQRYRDKSSKRGKKHGK